MAYIWANQASDFDNYNFYRWIALNNSASFYDNVAWSLNGFSYFDELDVYYAGTGLTAFAGSYIGYDSWNGSIYGGTITGIMEASWTGSWTFRTGMQGIALSAVAVYNASHTPSTADDFYLIATALSGSDTFQLSAFGDRARGYGGADVMYGNGGGDALFGGNGSDLLYGGDGADTLNGEVDGDALSGGAGTDWLYGGAGRDLLTGDGGSDLIFGGADGTREVFDFNSRSDSPAGLGRDKVYDFVSGIDRIDLSGIDAKASTLAVNEAFQYSGRSAASFSVWWILSSGSVILKADVTGDRVADIEIQLSGIGSLDRNDLVL